MISRAIIHELTESERWTLINACSAGMRESRAAIHTCGPGGLFPNPPMRRQFESQIASYEALRDRIEQADSIRLAVEEA